jgi:hypoxanthine phosphoribosyltransferase
MNKKNKILSKEKYKTNVHISSEQIAERISELGKIITSDYSERKPLLIGALTGSFIFLADLCRELEIDCEVHFVQISSYGDGTESSGKVILKQELTADIAGKDIIIVEDIVDTGYSLEFLVNYLQKFQPATIKIVALLSKPTAHKIKIPLDYIGFEIKNEFVIGYGLDYAGYKRNLKSIYTVTF